MDADDVAAGWARYRWRRAASKAPPKIRAPRVKVGTDDRLNPVRVAAGSGLRTTRGR